MSYGPILTIFLSIVAIGSILFLSTHSAFDAHLLLQAQGNKIHDKPSPSDFKRNNQISKSTDQDIDEKVNIKIKDSKSQKKAKNAEHVISSSSTTSSSSSSSSSSQCKLKARKSSCDISPRLLPYWSDEPDCFTSPLRRSSTHASDVDKRKYVVMQPDLGGWNNIRMALELGLLFAHVTGRIFVLPPPAVLYLLHQNKKWKDNYSTFADFLDFKRLGQGDGLKTIQMRDFLEEVALPGLLSKPLPNNDIDMKKQPLWDYLESACYTRQWSPGKTFIVFNITEGTYQGHVSLSDSLDYSILNASKRFQEFHLGREPVLYDDEFDSQRVVYFAGHEENRILMHFYGYLYFTNDADDRVAKRFARDRMRYVDEVYCSAGEVIDQLALLTRSGSMTSHTHRRILSESKHHFSSDKKGNNNVHKHDNNKAHSGSYKSSHHSKPKSKTKNKGESKAVAIKTNSGKTDVHNPTAIEARALQNRYGTGNRYIAYHIRRGDFQHKHTQIDANTILNSTRYLLPVNRDSYMIYISTDEKNRSFFDPFFAEFGPSRVVFIQDFVNSTSVSELNSNHVGMVEQLVCANAHTFIGCPLSTFTGYITRLRGYMNNTLTQWFDTEDEDEDDIGGGGNNEEGTTAFPPLKVTAVEKDVHTKKYVKKHHILSTEDLYSRTYYYMSHQMYQLHLHPRLHPPYWVRDFTDAFADIDEPGN